MEIKVSGRKTTVTDALRAPVSYTHLDVYKRQRQGRVEAGREEDGFDGQEDHCQEDHGEEDDGEEGCRREDRDREGVCLLYTSRCV